MIRPTLKPVTSCKPVELIRFTAEEKTHWALVGEHRNMMLNLLVLPLNESPYCVDIMGHTEILRPPFDKTSVLSYGTDYSISLPVDGLCHVGGTSKLTNVAGSYVLTAQDEYICCMDERLQGGIGYFDLKTGYVAGELGGQHAAFASCELALTGDPPTKLFQVSANESLVFAPPYTTQPRGRDFDNKP
jgi:hypothetical protein